MGSGPLAGIALAMAGDGGPKTAVFTGSPKLTISGSLYLPGTDLTMQGHPQIELSGRDDKLIAQSFRLIGNPQLFIEADTTTKQAGDLSQLRLVR